MTQQGQVYYEELPTIKVQRQEPIVEGLGISLGTWLCMGVVVLCVVVLVLASVSLGQSNHVNAQFNQLNSRLGVYESQDMTKKDAKVVAMRNKITLCGSQSYYSKKGESVLQNGDRLEMLNQTIEEMRESDMKEFYYYHLRAYVTLSVSNKVIEIEHTVTSSFSRLSSIRLEELEFNTVEQSLGAMRSTTLCTNNPYLDTQRCDASLTKRNILALRGIERVPLKIGGGVVETEAVKINADDELDEHSQRSQVLGLRLYNLVFYQAQSDGPVPNKTHIHGADSLGSALTYKEGHILTLSLTQC